MATPINTVPLGRSGTGSAFVLGESQAANNLLNTLQYNQQIAQQQERLKAQQAQQLAANWQKNQLKVDGGLYWQPEFNKRYQSHLEKGIQLRQMGIDPFNYNANDPNQTAIAQDYLLERQGILSDVDTRKALEANVGKQFGLVKGNPSKYYASDIENLNKYVETPFAEAIKTAPPTLTERFDPNTLLKTITPAQVGSEIVINNKRIKSVKALPQETRSAIVSAYTNSPATERWVDELTGRQGFTIPVLERIPNTKEAIEKDLKAQYDGNPDLRTQLATQGIVGKDSEAFKKYVNSETDRLYSAKSKWNNQIQSDLNQVLPKVKEMESILPDYSAEDQAMQRERLALARQANARAAANASGGRGNTDDAVLDRQAWIDEMLTGVPNSGERLKAVMQGRGYDDDLRINLDGNKINLVIPPKTTEKVSTKADGETSTTINTIPGKTVTIDKTAQGAKYKFNEILNELTGENIKVSKFATGEPSGKRKGDVVSSAPAKGKSASYSKAEENGIAAVMRSSGRSRAEVIQALKKAGRIK